MAESLLSKVFEMLFKMTTKELKMQMALFDNVNKLQLTLRELQFFLENAEEKRIEDASIKSWMNQIKDANYDIEDVLDVYHALDLSRKSDHNDPSFSSTHTCCRPPKEVFRSILVRFKRRASKHTIGVRIAELKKQLTEIMSPIPRILIIEFFSTRVANQAAHNQLASLMTHPSPPIPTNIVGLRVQKDVWRLVEALTKQGDGDQPLVCAIVGMGGIGKTTRAKLVFDDPTIKNYFQATLWVPVSLNYDVLHILRSIIKSAGGDYEQCHGLNLLYDKVKDSLLGKRLFMVLDDMWETECVWEGLLIDLLKSSATKGSTVLVTTRNKEVAHQMMATHTAQVEPLSLEEGWSLLYQSAFPDRQQQEAKDDIWNWTATRLQQEVHDDIWNPRDIGRELVKKCGGLPLVINIVGRMLSRKSRTKEAWELVLKSSGWEVNGLPKEIHSALYISYENLPSNIKQCFLYCSLFPKDDYFCMVDAKNLWIEEGLIKEDTYAALHELANSYISILLQRNLLMVRPEDFTSALKLHFVTSAPNLLKMHNLVYSLALFLMQNESVVATGEEILNNKFSGRTTKLRRLSIVGGGVKTLNILPKNLEEQVSLRTLLIFDRSICKIDDNLFNHLRHLRILWLENTNVSSLPDSLGSLELLRYLNLSNTSITELPNTIENLKNLRTLDVSLCANLYTLPTCVMKLHSLRSLATLDSGLTHLPPGLGKLNKLQRLDFIPSKQAMLKSSTMKELGTHTELRELVLCKLERVLDRSQAKNATLKDKNHLQILKLCCSESDSIQMLMNYTQLKDAANKIEGIFEDLCPPPQLKDLVIENYYGINLPNWLGHASFHFLSVLQISNCKYFQVFNGLGLLPSLETLIIKDASSIKSIGPRFYTGNDKSNIKNGALFPRLKILTFESMYDWEEWSSSGKAIPVMPCLEELVICDCPKLKSVPSELLHHAAKSMKKIRMQNTRELQLKVIRKLPSLELLFLDDIPNLEKISRLPALRDLFIIDCPGIKSMKLEQRLDHIQWNTFNVDSLPGWFSSGLNAFALKILCKEELLSRICLQGENEADEMPKIFEQFDHVDVYDEECLRLICTKNPRSFIFRPVGAP